MRCWKYSYGCSGESATISVTAGRCTGHARASFTIEAAVIVPMTMLILMAVIFLSFHVHDKVSIVAATQYAALVQAESSLAGSSGLAGPQQGLSRQLIRATDAGLSVSGDADSVTAEASAGFTVPIPMVDLLTNHALQSISVSVHNRSFNGRKKLLLYKSICDGVQDLTGGGS